MIWIGADPGGISNFGAAILFEDSSYCCKDVNSVSEFIAFIQEQPCFCDQGQVPNGIGIDAPLWWSTKEAGARNADIWIRKNYRVGNSVSSINSLRGAALIQGVVLALELRRLFPEIGVTETHPKAMLRAMYDDDPERESKFFNQYLVHPVHPKQQWTSEHQRDALISAICARETFSRRWTWDLAKLKEANVHADAGAGAGAGAGADAYADGEVSSGIVGVSYGWPPI